MWWDINCVLRSRWGNEERTPVAACRAKTLLWRKGRKNSLLIKSQIKSMLLSNKYDNVSYHTFIQQAVAGAASVYQVRQALERPRLHKILQLICSSWFSTVKSESSFMSVLWFIWTKGKTIMHCGIFLPFRFLFMLQHLFWCESVGESVRGTDMQQHKSWGQNGFSTLLSGWSEWRSWTIPAKFKINNKQTTRHFLQVNMHSAADCSSWFGLVGSDRGRITFSPQINHFRVHLQRVLTMSVWCAPGQTNRNRVENKLQCTSTDLNKAGICTVLRCTWTCLP